MSDNPSDQQRRREIKRAELEGRKYQKGRLESELDRFIQTHQDATVVTEQLAIVQADIARLEDELLNS